MEILDFTLAGVSLQVWLIVVGGGYMLRAGWRDWRKQRALSKELDEAQRKFKEEHVWQPRMIGTVDCGAWVRKDGRPVEIDD